METKSLLNRLLTDSPVINAEKTPAFNAEKTPAF